MIWVVGNVDGHFYREPFSKGVLARSLRVSNLGADQAYEIASDIEDMLIEMDVDEISISDLADFIYNHLYEIDSNLAYKFQKWRKVRQSKEPLIILIGGASGVGTSSMAFE